RGGSLSAFRGTEARRGDSEPAARRTDDDVAVSLSRLAVSVSRSSSSFSPSSGTRSPAARSAPATAHTKDQPPPSVSTCVSSDRRPGGSDRIRRAYIRGGAPTLYDQSTCTSVRAVNDASHDPSTNETNRRRSLRAPPGGPLRPSGRRFPARS